VGYVWRCAPLCGRFVTSDTLNEMAELEIQVTERPDGGRTLSLTGPLTLNTLFDFQSIVRKVHTSLVIDLARVPYMDSAGLGAVLGAFASCQRNNHKFGLVNVPERVRVLLQVAHVDNVLPLFNSVEAAEAQSA
jgi:anti-sigma B factor antagonist